MRVSTASGSLRVTMTTGLFCDVGMRDGLYAGLAALWPSALELLRDRRALCLTDAHSYDKIHLMAERLADRTGPELATAAGMLDLARQIMLWAAE